MVHECAHVYETGLHCRRIAGRGQQFCPGHGKRTAFTAQQAEKAFEKEMFAWVDQLTAMGFEEVLSALTGTLAEIQPLIEAKSSRHARASFTRATIATGVVLDRVSELFAGYRREAEAAGHSASPAAAQTPRHHPGPAFSFPGSKLP